jgi:hypothetical protein
LELHRDWQSFDHYFGTYPVAKNDDKLEEAALYMERNRNIVKSIASFPYIVKST